MTTLENLFYGNITPNERSIVRGGEYDKILRLMNENDIKLSETLSERQIELFEKFKDCETELSDISLREMFISGFSLGINIAYESIRREPTSDLR